MIPAGSLLARWQSAESLAEKQQLAEQLQGLLTGPPPPAGTNTPDAALYNQLTSLAGPLFAGVTATHSEIGSQHLGTRSEALRQTSGRIRDRCGKPLCPSALGNRGRLPADLVANSEFVTTGALAGKQPRAACSWKCCGSGRKRKPACFPRVQPSRTRRGCGPRIIRPSPTRLPVVTQQGSTARKRMEAAFEEFRRIFPAALCYTKIVPVDEVVTLTLFHREDEPLSRLMLDEPPESEARSALGRTALRQPRRDRIGGCVRAALAIRHAGCRSIQVRTAPQADPTARRGVPADARRTEPRHVDAVLKFADRAYRRPLSEAEKTQLRDLYRRSARSRNCRTTRRSA